ncbi:DUF995 domain-containing protein [Mesorhizobium atlanticum]
MRTGIGTTAETTSPCEPGRLEFSPPHRLARGGWLVPLLVACGQLAFSGAAVAAPAKDSATAEAAAKPDTAPTAFELQLLYADRTWNWNNGAAYFGMDRRLHAWTKGEDPPAVGEGRWLVTEKGKMCMELACAVQDLLHQAEAYLLQPSCRKGQHRAAQGSRRHLVSDFKHAKDDPADEHQKFEAGNTKGAQFDETRKLVDSKS